MDGKRGFGSALALLFAAGVALQAQVAFGVPVNLGPSVNDAAVDGSPSITADGRELYFHSTRPGGQGGLDLWVSTRASTGQGWGRAVNLGSVVNAATNEVAPTISADGLELVFSDYGTPRPGGFGKTDLWVTKRASRSDPWSPPVNLGPLVNSAEDEITPVLSADGFELIFDSYRSGSLGASDLWVARRATNSAQWERPEWMGTGINSAGIEHCPTITADGLTLLFDWTPTGQATEIGDLMLSTRASLSAAWGPAINLGHGLSDHWAAGISADGKTLYYTSSSEGGRGAADIWQVTITLDGKKPSP